MAAIRKRRRRQVAQQNADWVVLAAQAAGVACQTAVAYAVQSYEEIIDAAVENQCDLIFMASHGRRGLSRMLVGSVAQNVLA